MTGPTHHNGAQLTDAGIGGVRLSEKSLRPEETHSLGAHSRTLKQTAVKGKEALTDHGLSGRHHQAATANCGEPPLLLVRTTPKDDVIAIDPDRNPLPGDRIPKAKVVQ